jgi:hypothetical protein
MWLYNNLQGNFKKRYLFCVCVLNFNILHCKICYILRFFFRGNFQDLVTSYTQSPNAKWVGTHIKKKLGRGGKDRPPGIILRRDRNMVPAEKIPEPWPPITSGPSPPTLQRPSRRVARRT